jgi:putative copper export protein
MQISLHIVRTFVHVLAAMIWVGGQLSLAGLMPAIRTLGPGAPKVVAKRFGLLSWPAFAVLTFTGIWNAFALNVSDQTTAYKTAFGIKMSCYLVAGFGAALHTLVPKVWAQALGGAAAALGSVGALFFVIVMTKQ